jgi:NADH:ubiquinone oxidoreductase subunit E
MDMENLDREKLKRLDDFIETVKVNQGELINVLREAQEIFGFLPNELQLHIARKLEIPAAKVFGVATFYSYFSLEQRGKHLINVCMGTACFVKGS